MAITTTETYGIRRTYGNNPSIEVPYIAYGSESETAIKDAIYADAPETRDGLVLSDVTVENIGGGKWECSVTYGLLGTPQTNENAQSVQWDLSAQQVNVKVSKDTIRRYAPYGQTAPDLGGAIEWDGERVNGVDVNTGAFTFSVTRQYTDDECNECFMRTISTSAFKMNDDAFWMWDRGEVLFMGASGGRNSGGAIVESGDDDSQLSGYDGITGISSLNTDAGKLYVKMVEAGGYIAVTIYKSTTMTAGNAVASYALGAENTTVPLVEENSSGVGGTVHIDTFTDDTTSIVIEFPFPWSVTFKFAVSENATVVNELIGYYLGAGSGAKTHIDKIGWDRLWIKFEEAVVGTGESKAKIQRPLNVYIERVYDFIDFDLLKLGSSPWVTCEEGS